MPRTYPHIALITQDWEPWEPVVVHEPKAHPIVNVCQLITPKARPIVNICQLITPNAHPIVNVCQLITPNAHPMVNLNQLRARRIVHVDQLSTQDWEPVVLHKSKAKSQELRDPKAVNQALRTGAPVQTIKKFDAGSNKKAAPVLNSRKLDEGTEPGSLERVRGEVRQAIQKARLEKKMSQAELAKLINERPQVVQGYENGKAVPNQAVLAKMEKALGVKLRGKISK